MNDRTFFSGVLRRLTVIAALTGIAPSMSLAVETALSYDSFRETKTLASLFESGSTILVNASLVDSALNSISNSLFFRAGSSQVSLVGGWLVAPTQNRTVGVNIDLYDSQHTLVATDVFLGVTGSLATSRLSATNLIPGAQYELVMSGTAAETGRYTFALTSGGVVAPDINALTVAAPAPDRSLFDTHSATKTFGTLLTNGGEFFIDGDMDDDALNTVLNDFTFSTNAGFLSAGIEWIVGTTADPDRTVGFNVDVLNSNSEVVTSDTFRGLQGGEGFSQLVAAAGPGTYTLRVTGNAAFGSRYRIHLTTNEVPPGFESILGSPVAAVPEPATWLMLIAGLCACQGLGWRRRGCGPRWADGTGHRRSPVVLSALH